MSNEKTYSMDDVDSLVHADKLQLLYQQSSYPAVFFSLSVALLLTVILWPVQNHKLLLGWFFLLSIASVVRIGMFLRYQRASPKQRDVLEWERPYLITLVATTLIWGLGSVAIMPEESLVHQVVIFTFVLGLCGGAISVYSAHRLMILVTVGTMLLPPTIWMFYQATAITIGIGAGALLFMISVVRASRLFSLAHHNNFTLTRQLALARDQAEKFARMDVLTGLYNRRAFTELAANSLSYCERHDEDIALLIIDIDQFKQINDTRGHAAGDRALQHIGRLLQSHTRQSDVCARLGGEEFGILLMSTDMTNARKIAEKLRQEVEQTPIDFAGSSFNMTTSIGVSCGSLDYETLFRKADSALYDAKMAGRNQVCLSDQ